MSERFIVRGQDRAWQPDFHHINPNFPPVYSPDDHQFHKPTLWEQELNQKSDQERKALLEARKREEIKTPEGSLKQMSSWDSYPRHRNLSIHSEITWDIKKLVRDEAWKPEMGTRLFEIQARYGTLTAERFIEDFVDVATDPRFDFKTYHNLFLRSHRKFGKKAADYFALSYSDIVLSDLDPNVFYKHVEGAVNSGGKVFASYYADSLPGFWKEGGDPVDLLANASAIREVGGVKLSRSFIVNARTVAESGYSLSDYKNASLFALETFGKDVAYWIVRAIPQLQKMGYAPQRFIQEISDIHDFQGATAAKWFAAGMANFAKEADALDVRRRDPRATGWRHTRSLTLEESLTNLAINVDQFKGDYLKVLDSAGMGGATLFAILAQNGREKEFDFVSNVIVDFARTDGRKILSKAAWFLPKITADMGIVMQMLGQLHDINQSSGEAQALLALRYTYGARKSKNFNHAITFPTFKPGTSWSEIIGYYERAEYGIPPDDESIFGDVADGDE